MKPFDTLTEGGQVRRLRAAAMRHAVPLLAGRGPVRLRTLVHGENTTFDLRRRGARYCLRISRPGYQRPEWIASELAWLRSLAASSLRVPLPACDAPVEVSGPAITGPRWAVLLRWVDGRFVKRDRATAAHLYAIGVLTARLHEASAGWRRGANFMRPVWDAETMFGDGALWSPWQVHAPGTSKRDFLRSRHVIARLLTAHDRGALDRSEERVANMMRRLDSRGDARGLIHADLHLSNVLFNSGVAGAIDFDDCGDAYWLHDLGVTMAHMGSRAYDPALRAALLAGYRSVRVISAQDERLVPLFTLGRQVQLVYAVLSHIRDLARDADVVKVVPLFVGRMHVGAQAARAAGSRGR